MKKFLAIALTVVMILGVASSALAFTWDKAAEKADNFGYKIEVIKFTKSTGAVGSASYNIDANAAAVNGADVYFAIRLTTPDIKATDKIRAAAEATVTITSIDEVTGVAKSTTSAIKLNASKYDGGGVFYYDGTDFAKLTSTSAPVFAAKCIDTDTAKVTAKVTSKSAIPTATFTDAGGYTIVISSDGAGTVSFTKNGFTATFTRDSDGKVAKDVQTSGGTSGQELAELYRWLNNGSADAIYTAIDNGTMYMTNDNLRTAFGWNYKSESVATWKANSTPIILDPNITIPKTGDNTSVIGFAMIMVALVAAVAVKKVNA